MKSESPTTTTRALVPLSSAVTATFNGVHVLTTSASSAAGPEAADRLSVLVSPQAWVSNFTSGTYVIVGKVSAVPAIATLRATGNTVRIFCSLSVMGLNPYSALSGNKGCWGNELYRSTMTSGASWMP